MRDRKKRIGLLLMTGLLAAGLCSGCGYFQKETSLTPVSVDTGESEDAEDAESEAEEKEEEEPEGNIYVFVCGQVKEPGVYELPAGSRIFQAVELAGGMLESADATWVNQAEALEDGQRIYIPTVEEAAAGEGAGDGAAGATGAETASGIDADGRVNLNTATKEELMTLTGIGEKKAEAILQYRDTNGGFQTTEELMQVEGIKEGTFEKIKEDIVV